MPKNKFEQPPGHLAKGEPTEYESEIELTPGMKEKVKAIEEFPATIHRKIELLLTLTGEIPATLSDVEGNDLNTEKQI